LKTKLALIVVSVILVGSLAANAYFYALQQDGLAGDNGLKKQAANLQSQLAILSNQTDSLQSEKTNLETQVTNLENQTAYLQNQTDSLQSENSKLQDENAAVQNQIDQVRLSGAPRIVTRLGATDVRSTPAEGHPWSGVIRFYISGEVWNIGTGSARDCRLHVMLYQGETVANDTYVELGTINAGTYVDVAEDIYYFGETLTNWTIIPEYT
jgi:regulator of replication initiation timing